MSVLLNGIAMTNGMNMAKKGLKTLATLIALSFFDAANAVHIEPVFNEAAGGSSESGGVTPAKFDKGILPGVRDAMTADNTSNRVLRDSRQSSANFSRENLRSIHIQ